MSNAEATIGPRPNDEALFDANPRPILAQLNWAIVDQALSSGTNFILALLVVRSVTSAEFGAFSIVTILYILAIGASRAIVTEPVMIRCSGIGEHSRDTQHRSMSLAFGIGLVCAVPCFVGALTLRGLLGPPLAVLAVAFPFLILQDTGRGLFFAEKAPRRAALNDGVWAGLQFAMMGGVLAMDHPALWLYAAAWLGSGALAGIVALGQLRVVPHLATAVPWMRANRTLSVPLFFNFALTSGPQYLAFAIAPIVSSLRQLGLARAAFVPFGAMGIMLQSAPMVLLPNAAHRSADSVKRLARRVALLLGGIAVLWGVVVLATPARVGTRLLGADWQATRPAQAAYAFMVLAQALAIGPAVALRVLERPRSLVRVRLVAMPAVLILGVVLAHRYGAPGTASAVLAGEAITAVGLTWTVTRLRPDSDTRSETGRARAVVEHSRAKNNPSILIVTTVPATMNGFLLPYIEHLGDCGWQVDLATGPGSVAARARAVHEVPWTRSPKDVLQLLRSARVMRSILVEGRFDIVHVHTPIAAAITRGSVATMRRSSRPSVVYTAHGFHFMPGQSLRRRLPPQIAERMAGRYTNRLVVINETDRASAQRLRLVQSKTIVQMPGIGVDLDWYNETPELLAASWAIRDHLAMKRGDVLITMIGELFERKGPQDAVEALALASHENVHLAIAGTGPTREALELQIQTLGLSDRVHLMGQMPDVRPLILASRATTLPSYREGLSRAVLESLALGIPVLGSDIRGIADSVQPDGGLLFAPGDVVAIAKAFDAIAEAPFFDEAGRLRLRRRLEQYSITSLIDRHDALYEDLLLERTQR